jgi:hypothetical protein
VEVVVHGASLEEDPKTILAWCKGIAMSHATLQKRCDAVGVTPKASHDFMRLLHVVLHHGGEAWNLQRWLNIVDDRTTCALRQRAGSARCGDECPISSGSWPTSGQSRDLSWSRRFGRDCSGVHFTAHMALGAAEPPKFLQLYLLLVSVLSNHEPRV